MNLLCDNWKETIINSQTFNVNWFKFKYRFIRIKNFYKVGIKSKNFYNINNFINRIYSNIIYINVRI